MNENEKNNKIESSAIDEFNFEQEKKKLQEELEKDFSDLDLLKEDKEKIANPDALGQVVLKEVWKQFGNQIGLDMTNETLIQAYNKEHPEEYNKAIADEIMKDERYKKANADMKEQQQSGSLKDGYTGKDLKVTDKANLDHVVPRKELYNNDRRKQAGIDTKDLANKEENLVPTNESLNKSKKEKSNKEYVETREQREKDLKDKAEKAHNKIDKSEKSAVDKRLEHEKVDKRLQDKLDADDDLMLEKDRKARKAINKDIAKGAVKQTGKKAGKDALKTMAVQALFEFLKEVMNALVRFFKQKSKSFKSFLDEMKTALSRFFSKITSFLRSGVATAVGTIVSEIFGPIVSLFQKLASLIKQGFRSIADAIAYLKNKNNRKKSFSVKVAEVGKIIVAGLVAMGAIFGGEVFEKALLYVCPVLGTVKIPLLGSLANMIGLFLASMISGIIGAIILNIIDKAIANQQKADNVYEQVKKGNDILEIQSELIALKTKELHHTQNRVVANISERHEEAGTIISDSLKEITKTNSKSELSKEEIKKLLEDLNRD